MHQAEAIVLYKVSRTTRCKRRESDCSCKTELLLDEHACHGLSFSSKLIFNITRRVHAFESMCAGNVYDICVSIKEKSQITVSCITLTYIFVHFARKHGRSFEKHVQFGLISEMYQCSSRFGNRYS